MRKFFSNIAKGTLRSLGIPYQSQHERIDSFSRPFDPKLQELYASNRLSELFYSHQGRLAHKWGHYFGVYDRHLSRYQGTPVRLLEIGVSHGGSLQLWRKYFGPAAVIYGIDLDKRCKAVDDPDLCVRIGSQTDRKFLRSVIDEMGGVDVVIDDGSHVASHQRITFETLFPLIDANGVFIGEDLLTSYFSKYEGGLRRKHTFIEEMKLLVDDMHAWYMPKQKQHYAQAHQTVSGIHFYDSMVVVEKRPTEKPFHTEVGKPSF